MTDDARRTDKLLIALNPDPESKLKYLVRLPLGSETLVLKTADSWPKTAKVYCHPVPDGWPEGADIVEELDLRSCVRRGRAIDVVLCRQRQNRSQFVFTKLKNGRQAIFWQTASTSRKARPRVAPPTGKAVSEDDFVIVVDSRERYPYRFAKHELTTVRQSLPAGDYGVFREGALLGTVERKTLQDLATSMANGTLRFQLSELALQPRAAVVVEDRYSALAKLQHVRPSWALNALAEHQVQFPRIPIVFCDTRGFAEEWTYRFLGAAWVLSAQEQ